MNKVKYLCPGINQSLHFLDPYYISKKKYVNIDQYQVYFIISSDNISKIKISYHRVDLRSYSKQSITFIGDSSINVANMLLSHRVVYSCLSLNHTFYLGIELAKLEISLVMNQTYVQN